MSKRKPQGRLKLLGIQLCALPFSWLADVDEICGLPSKLECDVSMTGSDYSILNSSLCLIEGVLEVM